MSLRFYEGDDGFILKIYPLPNKLKGHYYQQFQPILFSSVFSDT